MDAVPVGPGVPASPASPAAPNAPAAATDSILNTNTESGSEGAGMTLEAHLLARLNVCRPGPLARDALQALAAACGGGGGGHARLGPRCWRRRVGARVTKSIIKRVQTRAKRRA